MIQIDIDMPKNCMCCPFPSVGTDFYYCHCPGVEERAYDFAQAESIPDDCPLHEVSNNSPELDKENGELISRQDAIEHLKKRLYESALNNDGIASEIFEEIADNRVQIWVDELPPLPSVTADPDTISRQAVLDAIFSEPLYESGMKKRDSDIIVPAIYEKIKALPPSPSRPQWIPCSERLPEEDGDYWVTADPRYVPPGYRSTDVITWRGGKWVMADYFVLDGEGRKMPDFKVVELAVPIIAWMPLPEPYQGY